MKILFGFVLFLFACIAFGENWEMEEYDATEWYNRCYPEYRQFCAWFIVFICNTRQIQKCVLDSKKVVIERRKCKPGWTDLPQCLTPICNSCRSGEICTAPEKCDCLTTVGVCTNVPCDENRSCFPGTCKGQCICSPGFFGNDCQQVRKTPTIGNCEVTVVSNAMDEIKSICAAAYLQPETKWVGKISKISGSSSASFQVGDLRLPEASVVRHVKYPPTFGIGSYYYNLTIWPLGPSVITQCGGYNDAGGVNSGECTFTEPIEKFGLPTLQQDDILQISFYTRLGGSKEGSKDSKVPFSSFPLATFVGDFVYRSVQFKVDTLQPHHCLQNRNGDCPFFPIYLKDDITTEKIIQPKFVGWNDSSSGLDRYLVEVYLLREGTKGTLENTGRPVVTRDIKATDDSVAFSLDKSGVYSIELTVFDQANNNASARNIFIYSDVMSMKVDPEKPLRIDEAVKFDASTSNWWINDPKKLTGKITLSWEGHCTSNARFSEDWSKPVEPWNKGIDDLLSPKYYYGRRTIDELKGNSEGISYYTLSHYIDDARNWTSTDYNSSVKIASINYASLTDGTTVGLEFACKDFGGDKISEKMFVYVDTSPARLANATVETNSPDIYTSSVAIWVEERHSGIKSLNFEIWDDTLKVLVKSGSEVPKKREAPSNNARNKREDFEQPCENGEQTCYCTPAGVCYNYIQRVMIDHCWIDRLTGNQLIVKISITNFAGLNSSEQSVSLNDATKLQCRPVSKLTGGQIAAIVICVLILVAILIAILALLIRIYVLKKPPPRVFTDVYQSALHRRRKRIDEPIHTGNALYVSDNGYEKPKPESYEYGADPGYIYTANEYTSLKKLPVDSITLKEEISKGRMFVVNKAVCDNHGIKDVVVAKYPKNGCSNKWKEYFEEKVKLLGEMTPHENIVAFIGIVSSPKGQMMMVNEYCETTLKDWLSSIKKVTPGVLDDMNGMALNIASGVKHLHDRRIIHKRLLVKNVLLTKQFSQYVAKLIGFGPDRVEHEEDHKVSVPVKWLSPETLKTINDAKPVYNDKTDSWSYGILLWEIYTRASQQPYPELNSQEAKQAIISGRKMSKPDDCPQMIYKNVLEKCWDSDPKERPNLIKILNELEAFRGYGPEETGYYAPE